MDFQTAATDLVAAGRFLAAQGWAPATSGNYSARLDDGRIAITTSGRDKGQLTVDDIMMVEADGQPVIPGQRSSAETLLHTSLYPALPEIQAVLHTHSVASVTLSRWLLRQGQNSLLLSDYELLKAFPGVTSHEAQIEIPILANSQDMVSLGKAALERLSQPHPVGYIIAGHGLYSWGATVERARVATEALEVLISCVLQELLLAGRAG